MRKNIGVGIGTATAAIALTMGASAALAASSGHQQAGSATATAAVAHTNITKAQARHIALAKVPHSRVIEVESDDLHDHPVWKVQLATAHGRVIVDVDKRTGKATIIRNGHHGDDRREDRGNRHDRDDRPGHDRDGADHR